MDTVWMQSPEGEVEEVQATADVLVPLMVAGWKQIEPPDIPAHPPAAPAQEE